MKSVTLYKWEGKIFLASHQGGIEVRAGEPLLVATQMAQAWFGQGLRVETVLLQASLGPRMLACPETAEALETMGLIAPGPLTEYALNGVAQLPGQYRGILCEGERAALLYDEAVKMEPELVLPHA